MQGLNLQSTTKHSSVLSFEGKVKQWGTKVSDLRELPGPQVGPQTQFYESEADIVIYGGAAGGGKSFGLLIDFAKPEFLINPRYGFVIFRRTSPEITNEGGLWDASQALYRDIGGRPRMGDHSWTFPSGAGGRFSHLVNEDDKYKWQGTELARIGFDELPHFSEGQFFYLLSRNRSTSGVKPQVRATCNPEPGWVKRFLSPWLDRSFPNPAKSGEIRHFIREEGLVVWVADDYRRTLSAAEMALEITDEQKEELRLPKSVTFIRSTIFDNQELLKKDPGYLSNLKSLPAVEQSRLLHGDWDVFEGSFFDEWSETLHTKTPEFRPRTLRDSPLPTLPDHWEYFGGMDWGYSEKSAFAFGLLAMDELGCTHVIEEIYTNKKTNEDLAVEVCSLLSKWGVPLKIPIACDGSMWSPTRTQSGYNGEKDIEAFWRAGLSGCAPADKDRQAGWSQVRRFLHIEGAFKVWKGYCPKLIDRFPEMKYSETRGKENDMDTDGDDHLHDMLRYALMMRTRPAVITDEIGPPTSYIDHVLREKRAGKANTYK